MLERVISESRKELGAVIVAPGKNRDTENGDEGNSQETFGTRIF